MHSKLRVVPTLPVHDIERACRFYQDKLGFTFEQDQDDLRLMKYGDQYALLQKSEAPRGETTAIVLLAEDFDSTVKEFKEMGMRFEEYPDMPGTTWNDGVAEMGSTRCFWTKDTEGNIINVHDAKALQKTMRIAA
jgi:predicted enzyme related to lactoylglutathione lyase